MKTYKVPVTFTFQGVFKIRARSAAEAEEFATKHVGMVAGSIHSSLSDEDVDWDFPVHPERTVGVAQ